MFMVQDRILQARLRQERNVDAYSHFASTELMNFARILSYKHYAPDGAKTLRIFLHRILMKAGTLR
jgi:hypothetical protein